MSIKINSGLTRNYTKVPNEIFDENQLSTPAKLLYIALLRYCGNKDYCYPSQKLLSIYMGVTTRQTRNYLDELYKAGIVFKRRTGFNKPNTYKVSNCLNTYTDKKTMSPQIGTKFPLHTDQQFPTNRTYLKLTEKMSVNKFAEKRQHLINSLDCKFNK